MERTEMFLEQIGADPSVWRAFEASAIAGQELGRVSFASHEQYRIFFEAGECDAVPAGRLRLESELPAVGDWVTARPVDSALALIETVLPRRTQFSRRAPGKAAAEQVIASNI
ncbi:MAG: ribosome small subunit-dependent GTPase A, partial [Acidobacteriia bacterium]|nr:ribosome small subunit-dependent GTPase A [Terriglobia bacterium]